MILRFKLFSMAGATVLLSAPSDAFVPAPSRTTTTARRSQSLNRDWDNDDFLSSLGGGEDEMERANESYWKQAENRAAMDEWKARKYREEMAAASNPKPPPPPQQQMAPPPQQQQFFDANGNPISMPAVYDANGNPAQVQQPLVQQPSAPVPPQQPLAAAVPPGVDPVVEPPLPPKTKGGDASPRPVGYNKDAWTVSNTADLYFAQLKQDSKVRKLARMAGDIEKANQVFVDDSVRKIGESYNENPYTKEKRRAEAGAEIENIVRMHTEVGEEEEFSSGVSYRQRLEMAKAKRGGGGSGGMQQQLRQPPQEPAAVAPPKVEQQPAAVVTPPSPPPPKPVVVSPPPAITAPPKMEQPKVGAPPQAAVASTPPPQQVAPAAVAVQPSAPAAASPASSSEEEDELRPLVRTLQGLLIKHRGGPGFGAGRLKAPEAQRLEDTLEKVKVALRAEAGIVDVSPVAAAPQAQPASSAAAQVPPAQPAQTQPQPQKTTAAISTPPKPLTDQLAQSVSRVEAALQGYKSCPPTDREKSLMALCEALMFAISATNKHIAETELRAHRAAMEAGPASVQPAVSAAAATATPSESQQPMMGFPTEYAVTQPDASDAPPQPAAAAASSMENERKLEDAYSALKQYAGTGGKLGLKNISGNEAGDLADKIAAMRGVLLDELNGGS